MPNDGLNGFDLVGLIIIFLCALRVTFIGFVREVATLAWLIVGATAGFLLSGAVGSLLAHWLGQGPFSQVLGFIIVFLIVFLIVKLLENSLSTVFEGLNLQALDRLLGFFVGAVEGLVVVFVIYFLLDWQTVWNLHQDLAQSIASKVFAPFLPFAQNLLPGTT